MVKTSQDIIRREHESPASAKRALLIDLDGNVINSSNPLPITLSGLIFSLNSSLTGLSNEFGACATPATLVIDNNGEVVTNDTT